MRAVGDFRPDTPITTPMYRERPLGLCLQTWLERGDGQVQP
jgi:hypothetical protein